MSSESEPEARKLTVAELLAQNGGGQTTDGTTGRRRRAEDAAEETAPQAIIERVRGTNPGMAPAGEPDADGSETSGPAEPAQPADPATRHLPAATEEEAAPGDEAAESVDGVDQIYEDEQPPTRHSVLREWLGLLGVIVGGVIGGAAVWLLFNWLWTRQWIVALVIAILVIAGAALAVRTLWRSRDAATLILTVVAGLIVTVSPAILLSLRS